MCSKTQKFIGAMNYHRGHGGTQRNTRRVLLYLCASPCPRWLVFLLVCLRGSLLLAAVLHRNRKRRSLVCNRLRFLKLSKLRVIHAFSSAKWKCVVALMLDEYHEHFLIVVVNFWTPLILPTSVFQFSNDFCTTLDGEEGLSQSR